MAGIATVMSNILVNLARKRHKKLTELEMHLAEYLKNLYSRKEGRIRKTEEIRISLTHHTAINQN
jgi:hypothetical protein